jgi:hypothetical protein
MKMICRILLGRPQSVGTRGSSPRAWSVETSGRSDIYVGFQVDKGNIKVPHFRLQIATSWLDVGSWLTRVLRRIGSQT